ncbi:hypothetical protein [Lacicoccus qingdaonensis]|uniref:Uncharacterized protein n=1 Tax=Lacicoccus qingdaonensis TaxID=576118 RepID=A0A1G9FMK2_9BACL|nr:hypothetical protein [Salinicoccus qingdaonensis]SDK89611.1 hypothetical protein SAMN05216216_11316 [Salinicoccus qingdaonensis]
MKHNENVAENNNESNDTQSEVIELKSFSLDSSAGMMCDADTGICGPLNEEKEDEK